MANKEDILNVQVSNETYESLTKKVFERMEQNEKSFIVAVNPEKVMKARNNNDLKELINHADFQIPDGVGILLASKVQGGSIHQRITGIDLMMELLKEAVHAEKRIFLYGAKPGVVDQAKENLLRKFPSLKIAGTQHGYIDDEEVIRKINKAKVDILFVALGSPKQEEWIRKNKPNLHVSVFQGVGGSFDVIAGNINRAPAFFRKAGLEWLYRLLAEPSRWKRQLALPKFIWTVMKNQNKE